MSVSRWIRVVGGLVVLVFATTSASGVAARHVHARSIVRQAVHHDTSLPLRKLVAASSSIRHVRALRLLPRPAPATRAPLRTRAYTRHAATASAPPTIMSFNGIGNGFSGPQGIFSVTSAPPDTTGDVGPNNYVQAVNTDFAVFNKNGTVVYGPVPLNTLWSGFGGGCQTNNDGDPQVNYDSIADRWVISQFSVTTTPYLQCVAVSQTADPTGAYNRYSFSYTDFPDYPKVGVWPDGYYVAYNMFAGGTTFNGSRICALDRVSMLAGASATQQCFTTSTAFGGLLPADLDGSRLPPAGAPNIIAGLGSAANQLAYWKFHVDWATPANSTFTGPTTLATDAFAEACAGGTCIPQSGTTQSLDSLADRLMQRLAYRNFGDHQSLVLNHSVTAGSSTGVRWYELRPDTSNNLSIFQQGTYAPDANFRWMGSIAQDQDGNMGLGFSISSSTLHPGVHYTGRLAGDAAGAMTQGEGTIIDGAGSQTGSSLSRWGDYSSITVDPVDDCTFWFTSEYIPANGAFNWSTRIGSFKFASCGVSATNDFSLSATPSSLALGAGGTGTASIATATTAGSQQTISLAVSGIPAGATATLSPTSVTSGASSTLSVNAGTAAAGSYSLSVTGTSGSATHTAAVQLVIGGPVTSDFSLSASPTSLSLVQGSSSTSTISTAIASGSAQTIALSVSGAPAGATASLSPASVSSGQSSTLTISAGTASPGTYTLTITGTAGSATHSVVVSTSIVSAGYGSGIRNGGFEAGLSGWTMVNGDVSSSTSSHSGASAAQTGSTTATNGDSSIAQTFVVPSTAAILSFWTKIVCPDAVTYDWATATLIDTTAGTSATIMPKTCTNTGAWVKVSAVVVGSHTYTLTLTSHDDNYASDATYALYDDVELGSVGPPAALRNGGFETGDLTGWSPSGSITVPSTGHSGTYSARVGSTSATNGDSSIQQTFTAPVGSSLISFWYSGRCPDTVTYDWATALLKDNATGISSVVLPKTCSNSAAWIQVTARITAGHSYTLTLTSHDDNYASDPTFTLYDDVSIDGAAPPPEPPPVTPPPVRPPSGDFEDGTLSGWALGGLVSIVDIAHTGAHSVRLGSDKVRVEPVPAVAEGPAQVSSMTSSFHADPGTALGLWYLPACPAASAFSWARVLLVDVTNGTTSEILPPTCLDDHIWHQLVAPLIGGHDYQLTLTNSDSGAGEGTATFFDDIVRAADVTAPTVTVPGTIRALGNVGGATVSFSVTASDPDDSAGAPVCDHASGSRFPVGTTTVKCRSTDTHGNEGSASFDIVVDRDVTPPIVTVPATQTVEATSPGGAHLTFAASATDPDDPAGPVTCDHPSGSLFPLGDTVVSCSSTDSNDNVGSSAFLVMVTDTTPPVLTIANATIAVDATGPSGAAVNLHATAVDLVDGAVTPHCVPASGSIFHIGDTVARCTATDAHGNASGEKTVAVHVRGAGQQLQDLVEQIVDATKLPAAVKTALVAKARLLLAGFDASNPRQVKATCVGLQAFIAAVRLLPPSVLPSASATQLIASATRIRAVLAC